MPVILQQPPHISSTLFNKFCYYFSYWAKYLIIYAYFICTIINYFLILLIKGLFMNMFVDFYMASLLIFAWVLY